MKISTVAKLLVKYTLIFGVVIAVSSSKVAFSTTAIEGSLFHTVQEDLWTFDVYGSRSPLGEKNEDESDYFKDDQLDVEQWPDELSLVLEKFTF